MFLIACNFFATPTASHQRIVNETLSHYTDTIRDYCDTCGLLLQAAIKIDTYCQAGSDQF